jgi:two-component system NtrC family response regulator
MKRAVIMADGKLITAEDLDLAGRGGRRFRSTSRRRASRPTARRSARRWPRARTISRAPPKLLGISRPTLYDLLKQYGLQP